jgi:hypothetical protein
MPEISATWPGLRIRVLVIGLAEVGTKTHFKHLHEGILTRTLSYRQKNFLGDPSTRRGLLSTYTSQPVRTPADHRYRQEPFAPIHKLPFLSDNLFNQEFIHLSLI